MQVFQDFIFSISMFCYSYQAVALMGTGMSPLQAATAAINTIAKKYPTFVGAVVAANKHGEYGTLLQLL